MITLGIIIFTALVLACAVLTIAGSALIVFIDPIICVVLIVLACKLIKKIKNKK